MDVRDSEIVELLNQVEELEKKLFAHPMHKIRLLSQIKSWKFGTEYEFVLKKLGHTDADGVVQLRGRAACLIDTGDELLVIELMFNGESIFVSLLCFLYSLQFIIFEYLPKLLPLQIQLRTELARPLQQIQDSVRRIAEIFKSLTWPLALRSMLEIYYIKTIHGSSPNSLSFWIDDS
ncbi:hypothetical protein GYH30_018164 [Glycine max]|uniref:ATP-dependent RNA helicase Ski2/MTR4 C-terminal domain-containing protein n=1 Tax=Glycine max TaxID=3847 RepID=K7L118_SOYBN|nr:hypothetical protein JHK87_018208 [Glycine soja]KAG5037508.1 hypothetical protein JHK86_018348 [Glycine max]KAH1086511.1 hypothetical protein GYH30_018164 [Glycine max]